MPDSLLLALLVLVPLAGAGAVLAARRRSPETVAAIALAAAAVALVLGIAAAVMQPSTSWRWGGQLEVGLAVEGLARVMVVLVSAVALPVLAYAAANRRTDRGLPRLLALLAAFVGAMLALVAAADLLTLLVAWELVGACSWALIGHDWRDPHHPPAALQAFLTTRVGDLGLFAAAGIAVVAAGSARYDALGALAGWEIHAVGAGVLLAAAAKSAQLPFSPWLFSAMAGPTPVSALLHSATMVAAGAYVLARVVPQLAGAGWLAGAVVGLGLATALAGGIVATVQDDLKRALAASTSAQYGLVLVAVGAGSVAAAGAHLVGHATVKALLFLAGGIAVDAAGSGRLSRMRLGRALPLPAVAFAVGALALAAVPPLGAAWSKEAVLAAAFHYGTWAGAGAVVAGLLTAGYAGRLALLTYGPDRAPERPHPPPAAEKVAVIVLAGATIVLGVAWVPGAGDVVEGLAGGRLFERRAGELAVSVATVATGLVAVAVLDRRRRLFTLALPATVRAGAAAWLGLPALARRAVVDPTLSLARTLAATDDRVIDAGVRAAAGVAAACSRALSWWGERGVDGVVRGTAATALRLAVASRRSDERRVDGAVEALARGAGVAGHHSRRLQTGLAHQYYVLVGLGLLAAIVVAAVGS